MRGLKNLWNDLKAYPSAVVGLLMIVALIVISIYAVIAIPYNEAISLWRGGDAWAQSPRNARPVWANYFTSQQLPQTITLSSSSEGVETTVEDLNGTRNMKMLFTFDYPYDAFPQEINVFFRAQYDQRQPHTSLVWHTPDGREIRIGNLALRSAETYRFGQESRLLRRLDGQSAQVGLFADPNRETAVPLKGQYQLEVDSILFEDGGEVEATLVIYGQVHGMGGTDHRRRDLSVALLWGTPIALAFGLLAAVGTSVTTMIIAAAGVWFGGITDSVIQRVTEVNLILPVLPILIMVGIFFSRSIWVILGVIIILGIFSAGIKTFRAIFLQVKESPYIEAAQSYGASSWRIIFNYMLPRIVPVLIPQFVVLIPSFVFLEAGLAVLGLGDPVLPTWGKVIDDAYRQGALHNQHYYWVMQPAVLLMITGFAFSMVGFALDRVFNPKLREV
ncbi:MAG: ABC transporter permease [Chloroflexota bacterium]|jgi:peptide/nickel transport system permease protein